MRHGQPISMYVPARNAEGTLASCVESILAQSRPPDQLFIIVDPRSSDRTVEIARATGAKVIEQQGATLGAARNEGIAHARGRWLACCDSDVVLEPHWLARLAALREDGAAGIGGRTVERVRNPFDAWRALHMPHHWGDYRLRNPFMLVSEVLFDRDALLAVGGYRDDLNYHEDSDLCQRLRDAGYDLLYTPAAVAIHQRTDTLIGLLTLRWKYSEHRQHHLMDRFATLLRKADVNREYAVNTLSRCLAHSREELTYVSFLLFFHHLRLDLRSLMSRRPMIPPPVRAGYEDRLSIAMNEALHRAHASLAACVDEDLQALRSADGAEAPETEPPGWAGYLSEVRAAAARFCDELSRPVLEVIETSARYVHDRIAGEDVAPWPEISLEARSASLARLPIRPFVDAGVCGSIRQQWPDASAIRLADPVTETERAGIRASGLGMDPHEAGAVVFAPHLETRGDPLGVFEEVEPEADRLVVCYQPPARFVPGLDVPSAGDLASAAAAAGWAIERFDTLVGRTRLMLSRTTPASGAEKSSTLECVTCDEGQGTMKYER